MNQDKNNIKAIVAVGVAVILGEGVLGWGLYWPLLLMLTDWDGIYWLGLLVGVMVSVYSATTVGLPSLFIVAVLGAVSFFLGVRRGSEWWLILISLVANLVFDKLFGLSWNIVESLLILVTTFLVISWEDKAESIKVNYK